MFKIRDGYGFEYIVHAQSKCQKMNTPISEADIVERLSFSLYVQGGETVWSFMKL